MRPVRHLPDASPSPAYICPMLRWPVVLLLVLAAVLPADTVAQGCSMCKAVVTTGESGVFGGEQGIGQGLNAGILYLMAIPYLLIFLFFGRRIVAFFKEMARAQG